MDMGRAGQERLEVNERGHPPAVILSRLLVMMLTNINKNQTE